MSIKIRLILSYIGMILIPIILIFLFNGMLSGLVFDDKLDYYEKANPLKLTRAMGYKSGKILRQLNIDYLNNKEKLKDINYLKTFDKELDEIFLGIVVKENGKVKYVSDIVNEERILTKLSDFGENTDIMYEIVVKERFVVAAQRDFIIDDSNMSIYIIIDLLEEDAVINKAKIFTISVTILAVLIVAFGLTFSMYRGIIKPIEKLKNGTSHIKKGNLDYHIEDHRNDEMGNLIRDFEDMRLRLRRARDMQIKYEENRKNLISNISHDLKTPIMSIKGYIEGIKDGVAKSPEKMDKYINTIYDKANHMENLINELFLFSKLDLNKVEFDFQSIDIVKYLKYSIEDLSFDMEKIGGNIIFNQENEEIRVIVDLQRLQRVILNIIQNSIKYKSDKNLVIQINIEEYEAFVQIEIKDNGKGISKEDLPYIFDRFYRADKSRNTSIGGSGLGLAISKQIIKAHGGDIWAESELNKGTSIFFFIRKS
ncbi:sensor histidine kinase [Marinisporobacter balticus]|uniref:histidine kinase n=1 Tax=Marinisporobacter balticus TaxID=2018667 RepID=A0A4R2KJP7_9FIRM|nr:ATP-binding protein [Marinisporobacter balticus]TCO72657.1 HAMP domain-containing protein [Marinisporobacter balticus]